MNPYNLELYRTTYELESNKYPPLEETKNILYKTSHERLSSSPPIILCETNNSRNNKYHRHRYLFYPSASRLSPFSSNDNNINTIKNAINYNEQKDKNEKSPQKYQSMYDKSFELVKRISELVPLEDIKIKGNSEYYLNKDQDYMNIVDKEINTLTNHFKNNNINFGYNSEGNLNKNNNNNDTDKKNMTYDQYKNSLLQKIQDSKNENQNFEQNDERPYNDINNINNSNRNYINDYLNSKDNKKQENVEINQPEIKEENKNLNNKYRNKKDNINNNIDNNMNKDTLKEKEDEQIKNNMNDNKIPQYNTLGMIQNDNDNTNKKNNNIKNNITNQKSKIPYTLIDENNDKILSSDNKPFTGELISNHYQKGNQIFVRTKTGSDIKLNILRGKEGEPLCYKGYPLMGTGNKFFYDKDGNVIAYPDNEFIKGDKAIDVRILDNKNIKDFGVSNNFEINEGTGNSMGSIGEMKKIKMKSKWYMFPKGNGSAKAPVIKKKKKKNKI